MKKLNFILCLGFLLFSCKTSQEKEVYDLVIANGNTIDIETGSIHQQDIFITDGKIVKITDSGSNSDYIAQKKLEATGKYILPGFWDNHVHFRGGDSLVKANKDFLKLFIANGITTVRDAGGDLTTSVLTWKKEIANGRLIGPTIYTSGPKIDGPNATWPGSLVVENSDDVSKALDSLQRLKTDFVKIYESRISRNAYLETVSQATKKGLITSGHMPFTVALKENIDAGIDAIEHLYYVLKGCSSKEKEITQAIISKEYGFWQSMGKLINSYDEKTAQNTFKQLKENNVYVVPTLHIGHVLSYLDEENHAEDAYLKLMPKAIISTYEGRINRALNSSEKATKDRKELDTFFIKLVKSLSDANVSLLAGSDSGAFNSYTYPGISLHRELEAFVDAGIAPLKALQASAYNGAHFLKRNNDYGSISIHKVSDLVLLNANPLEDIKNTRRIFRIIKGKVTYNPQNITKNLDCQNCFIQ